MIIIPSAMEILRLLEYEEIPYFLCYPENTEESKEEYKRRYTERGNSEDFLNIFINGWDEFMCLLEIDDYGKKFILKPHEYLSDVAQAMLDGGEV